MSFGGLLFTNLGKNLQAKAVAGIQLNFTKIVIGDGELGSASILDLKNVVHEIKSLTITKLKSTPDGKAILGTTFANNNLTTGFYWREIGVYANDPSAGEILYCYGNAGVNAEYIPASGGAQIIEKALDLTVIVGNATNVTATIASGIYASKDDLLTKADLVGGKVPQNQLPTMDFAPTNHTHPDKLNVNGDGSNVTVTFIEATTDADIASGENQSTLMSKIKKRFSVIASSLANLSTLLSDHRNSTVVHVTASDKTLWNGKAPGNHASSANIYGPGTINDYGHVRLYNGLDRANYVDGEALPSNLGKILKDLIDTKGTKNWTKLGSYATIVATDSVPSGSITLPSNAIEVMFEVIANSLAATNVACYVTLGNTSKYDRLLFDFAIYKYGAGEPDSTYLYHAEIPSWIGNLVGDFWYIQIATGSNAGSSIPGITGVRLNKSSPTLYFWIPKTAVVNVYYR